MIDNTKAKTKGSQQIMNALLVDGDLLHFDDVPGPDGAPVIVWGHGFLLSAAFYSDVVDSLPDFRHIVPDLRGHGRSASANTDATLSRMATDIWRICESLEVNEFHYIGHSMGNAVGIRLTAAHPDAVLSGTSIAGIPVSGKLEADRDLVTGIVDLAGDAEQLTGALAGLFVHEGPEGAIVLSCGQAASLVPRESMTVSQDFFLNDKDQILPHLTQPWFFLVPGADLAEPPMYQVSQAELLPNARIRVLDGEGHMVPQERPGLVAEHIAKFLQGLRSGR